ncbi:MULTISPECIES: hypothetical protein [Salinicola]|jgi:long-subunit fatty acid transport protein|uniref:hypothetical protein n=1 Tax=Salinicola salarius TaxID=430457 RepID=UPI0026EBECD5|nr:hypothetical protein [Salinicola salarius]
MYKLGLVAGLVLTHTAGEVFAGAIERSKQPIQPLFESGRYLEFSVVAVSPNVSGVDSGVAQPGASSGNIIDNYFQFGVAYKDDVNDKWSYALILDQPYGADTTYPDGKAYFASGSSADIDSYALTGIARYKFNENFSIYGGLRAQTIEASARIPFVADYTIDTNSDTGFGWLAGWCCI